jgi:putative tricarboxylic transport membrane protein
MLQNALLEILSPSHLIMMNIGLMAGIIMGAMPGLSLTFTITVMLTLTYGMDSISGMYLLLGAYAGGMYGGSITAILINTPGTSNAVATVFDGYPLARQGRAGDALKCALVSSVIGGLFSAAVLFFLAPQVAKLVLKIGSPEYFALCLFGMFASVSVAGKGHTLQGVMSALIGLFISTIGIDSIFGSQRLMFGNFSLLGGVKVSTCMLGAYALSQVLVMCETVYTGKDGGGNKAVYKKSTLPLREILKHWKTLLRSSIIGTIIGAIPGTGGATSAMFCYNEARRASKHPETYGTGEIDGVIAAECGNNAVTGATMIPMLTLGIPGDSIMAIMLGALTMQGITPGAQLFSEGSIWVYTIMGGLFIINLFLLAQGSLFIRAFANISRVPMVIMIPCIISVCMMGGFAIGNTTFEVAVLILFGIVGYLMKRFDFPIPPLTIGLVLGSLFETNLRRSLQLSNGNFSIFFTRPICCFVILLSFAMLFMPYIKELIGKYKKTAAAK